MSEAGLLGSRIVIDNMQEFWVFGYGSLMWRPGFPYVKRTSAQVYGLHRALCVYSHVHRGTAERPGLVLGLDRGGSCHGIGFQIAPENKDETIAYLRGREQVTMVYKEVMRPMVVDDDGTRRSVEALFYIADRDHLQYAGRLSLDEQVRLVRQGVGVSGKNPEYLDNTVDHLMQMGVRDRFLEKVSQMARTP